MALMLVTGGAGFIGSHLVEELLGRGDTVRVVDNLTTGSLQNVRLALAQGLLPSGRHRRRCRGKLELVTGDLRDLVLVRKSMRGVDYVFHQAAAPLVVRSITNSAEVHSTNVGGTLNVLQAAQAEGVRRVIYASSCTVYGNGHGLPQSETALPGPRSPYAASKLAGEAYCHAFWTRFGLETVILRYFNVYGPRQSAPSEYARVIPHLLLAMLRARRPTINGDGTQTRDFVYVEDVVQANLAAAFNPLTPGKCLNVASGRTHSILELFELLNEILRTSLVPIFAPAQPGDVREIPGRTDYAREIMNYAPSVPLREGLTRTARFFSDLLEREKAESRVV
ncbi:MAG: NAD-dependent epimerase/dehydratase family protein [Candidatus Rokuibacteriota bacterium]